MASVIYDSFAYDLSRGLINGATDTYYLLLTLGYTPNKKTQTKRSDVTGEVTGVGYTLGGNPTAATLVNDTVNDKTTWTFTAVSWPSSTISASGGVIYKRRGGAATADELVAFVDFSATITSTAATFTATFSTPLTIQN
jgi:hypothetical protein